MEVEDHWTLVELLRDHLGLTGTKIGCDRGECGAGIGMALHEQLLYDKRSGLPLTAGYYGARIMTHLDAPEIEVVWVESEDPYGPYGAKTLGEPTIIPTVAAVANAFFNATGKRVTQLPLTRDKVLAALGGRA